MATINCNYCGTPNSADSISCVVCNQTLNSSAALPPLANSTASKAKVLVKTYKGTQTEATAAFEADAARLSAEGYAPVSQTWAAGSWSVGHFILALLLCIVFIGIIIFLYFLIVKPPGTLTVTYELRTTSTNPTYVPAAIVEPVNSSQEKTCPRCAETIKSAALMCRFCRYEFPKNS